MSQHAENSRSKQQCEVVIITGMVHVFKNDTCSRKPLPLLCHFSITNAALEDTNAAPKDW